VVLSEEQRKENRIIPRKKSYQKNKENRIIPRKKSYQKNKDKEKADYAKYRASAKGKAKINAYNEKDEVKKRKQEWNASSEQKKKRRAYQLTSEAKLLRVKRNQKLKLEVYSTLSKRDSDSDIPCCNCCGESSYIEFLTIDHVYGRTHLPKNERKLLGGKLSARVKKNEYPDDYQILCWNCNEAKMISKDNKCPHERK
jgi:hypothetical protein